MTIPSIHKKDAPKELRFAIATCSSSRYRTGEGSGEIPDPSGDEAVGLLLGLGHKVSIRRLMPDSLAMVRGFVMRTSRLNDLDAIILIGGTGVAYSDVTVEAVEPLLDKELSGFGEMFRAISFKEVGSSALLSRALAGTVNGKAVFCLPGAPEAVRLAVKELIIPEIGHITKLIKS